MSDFRELNPSILHPPVREPAASDGSPLTVIRDTQGQISEASGTGRDGVFRRLITTNKIATNPAGFHFFITQLHFYERGKKYLWVGSILSPDARKACVQISSGANQFGLAVSLALTHSQATMLTTTGSRATVDLSQVSLRSAASQVLLSSVPASAVHGTLPSFPQDIQEALREAGYFQSLFEQENQWFAADLDAALQAVNLSASMSAESVMDSIEGSSKSAKSWAKAFMTGIAAEILASARVLLGGILGWPAVIIILAAGVGGVGQSRLGDMIDALPEPPKGSHGNNVINTLEA